MPSATAPYQRIILNGVPYWKDSTGALYYYESSAFPSAESRICLGSVASGLAADWQTKLAAALASYRAAQKARPRALATAPPAH